MTEDSNIPHFLLDQCTDEILLLEHMPLLNPIVNFSEQQINVNSERIFRKHNSLLKFEKQIMQVVHFFFLFCGEIIFIVKNIKVKVVHLSFNEIIRFLVC